jgi:serine/threonine protein kinase/WD40 repeat protein
VPPPDPSSTPAEGRPAEPAETRSPVHRALVEDYVFATERGDREAQALLRRSHPRLAPEFDAVDAAWRRLGAALGQARGAAAEAGPRAADGAGPGGSGGAGTGAAQTSGEQGLLQRIARRSVPPERYRARREIARGGMGSIQRVWDEDLRRHLVMKVMLQPQDRDPAAHSGPPDGRQLSRFLEEAQITGQLDHPSIVPVHDIGLDEEGRLYFTMPLVKGQDLGRVIELARQGAEGWSRTRVLGVLLKVSEALAFAHDRGVVHRDLKPENIMVGRFGETYVMDWGLARVLSEAERQGPVEVRPESLGQRVVRTTVERLRGGPERLSVRARSSFETLDGDVVGTPGYMAPEQARGERERIGPRSDIYSLGAILYQLLSGCRPFDDPISRASGRPLLERLLEGQVVPVRELDRDQPDELVAICEQAMAPDPDDRYPSVIEWIEDLRAFTEGHVVRAYETGLPAEVRKWVLRNRVLASVIAAALLLLGGSAVAYVRQQQRSLDDLLEEQARTAEALVAAEDEKRRAQDAQREAELARAEEANERSRGEQLLLLAQERQRDLERSESKAQLDRERADRLAYAASLRAAEIALRGDELSEGRRQLDACAPALRGFEWRHLEQRIDLSLRSFESGAREPRAVAALPEGRAAVLDGDGFLVLLDLESGAELERLELPAAPRAMVVQPSGARAVVSLATGGLCALELAPPSGSMTLADPPGQAERQLVFGPLALGPDGNFLAAGVVRSAPAGQQEAVVLYDLVRGTPLDLSVGGRNGRQVTALDWSPSGAWLAVGFDDGSVELRDAFRPTSAPTHRLRLHEGGITALQFGADSLRLAVASADESGCLVDTGSGAVLHVLRGHREALTGIHFGDEDRLLVTSSADRGLAVWSADNGELLGRLRGHANAVRSLDFAAEGQRVLSLGDDRTLRLWDPHAGEATSAVTVRNLRPRQAWLSFSSDGQRLLLPSHFAADLWDPTTLQPVAEIGRQELLTAGAHLRPGVDEVIGFSLARLQVWGTDGEPRRTLIEEVPSMALSTLDSGGRRLAAVTASAALERWARQRAGAPPEEASTPFVPRGVASTDQRFVLVYDLPDLEAQVAARGAALDGGELAAAHLPAGTVAALALPPKVTVAGLALAPEGRAVLAAGSDGILRRWTLPAPGAEPAAAAPEEPELFLAHECLRDTALGQLARRMAWFHTRLGGCGFDWGAALSPVSPATSLDLSADGQRAAVGYRDGRVDLWDLERRTVTATLRGSGAAVTALEAGGPQDRLVSGCADGTLRIWDLELGETLLVLVGHEDGVDEIEFAPDGQRLASITESGELRLWETDPPLSRFRARQGAVAAGRAARNYLIAQLDGFLSASELMSRIDADANLGAELRARVQTYLQAFGENAARLNSDAWQIVQRADQSAERYRDALAWALFATALEPKDSLFRRTLGVAQFRMGRFDEAVATLGRSSSAHRNGRPRAEEYAVLALCHHALGQTEECRRYQEGLEELMATTFWQSDPAARALQRELRDRLAAPSVVAPPDSAIER